MNHAAYKPVLPMKADLALKRAAQTPIPPHDPLARVKAIEKATQQAKHDFPKFFKE